MHPLLVVGVVTDCEQDEADGNRKWKQNPGHTLLQCSSKDYASANSGRFQVLGTSAAYYRACVKGT